MADNLTTFMWRLSWNRGAWTSWNPQGLSRPVHGLLCVKSPVCFGALIACNRLNIYNELTKTTEQRPSWEADSGLPIHDIPRISWNRKVHYIFSQNPILCHVKAGQVPWSYFLKICFNIMLLLRPGLPSGLFPPGFPTRTQYASLLITCHVPSPISFFVTCKIQGLSKRFERFKFGIFYVLIVKIRYNFTHK